MARLPCGGRRVTWVTPEEALASLPNVLRQRFGALLATGFAAGVLGVAGSFLVPKQYTATVSFIPVVSSSSKLPANLAGIASQFGVMPPGGGFTQALFAALPGARYIREQVALSAYQLSPCLGADSAQGTLITAYGLTERTPRRALDDAVRRLASTSAVTFDATTSMVVLSSTACSPELAAQIVGYYLSAIDRFNQQSLRSQATAQREFAATRIAEIDGELVVAEADLVHFYERNRAYQLSPALRQEESRLKRQVSVLENTYLTVRTDYERARLEEARDLPALTIIDPPQPPARKSWPKRWVFGIVAAVLACTVLASRQLIALRKR